jgi:hypothetical protein
MDLIMRYCFKCFSCGNEIELEKNMEEIFTEEQLVCKKCKGQLIRNYQQEMDSKGVIVPDNMKGINQTKRELDYSKSPSKRKRFW